MALEQLPSVLLVDDEAENLDTFRRVFRKEFAMRLALSGQEAVALMRQNRFDVALVDYAMPEMNGLELLRRATTLQPEMARLMVTAHEAVPAVRQARADGIMIGVIPKPWNREQVLQAVATVLQLGRMRASVQQLTRTLKKLTSGPLGARARAAEKRPRLLTKRGRGRSLVRRAWPAVV